MASAAPRIHAAHFPAAVKNVLVVASTSHDAGATARIVARMQARESIRVHVLAVQVPPSGYARHFLRDIDLRGVLEAEGARALEPLRDALEAAGVPCRLHVEIGAWLPTISRFAREISCARIVLGENPGHAWRTLLLRHDAWRLRLLLRRSGNDCAVTRGDEPVAVGPRPVPREQASRPH
ncbi:MAG: universal stress protein [Usitatibacter sp.]